MYQKHLIAIKFPSMSGNFCPSPVLYSCVFIFFLNLFENLILDFFLPHSYKYQQEIKCIALFFSSAITCLLVTRGCYGM